MLENHIGKGCPYCQFPIKHDSNVVVCSGCKIPHHRECWEENGGCTTFGCQSDRNAVSYGQNPTNNILIVELDDEPQQRYDSYRSRSSRSSGPGKLSKSFYLLSVGLGFLGLIILGSVSAVGLHLDQPDMVIISIAIYVLLALYLVVVNMVFLYKIWEAIDDGYARTTPGKAVGFMFIPLFNIYWLFPAYWGFAKDFNKLILRRGLKITPISEGLFLAYPILQITLIIPYINFFTGIAVVIVYLCIINTACNKINQLSEA